MGIRQPTFLPPMGRMMAPAAGVAALGAAPAFADEIGDAAKKLAEASYPFAKGVDWNNGIYLQDPGAFKPLEAIKAIDKMIVMGAQADPKILKAAADAHHKAIGSISGAGGVTSKADWEAVNAALGRVIASVPESSVMDVYNSVSSITDSGVPAYLKSLVKAGDADAAYSAFLAFKDVVKKNQVASAADYEAVNAALGRAVASVPTSKVMDVYNAFASVTNPAVPSKLFSTVSAIDANAAAKAFYEFKDVVMAAQR